MKELQKVAIRQGKIFINHAKIAQGKPNPNTLRFTSALFKHGFELSQTLLFALNSLSKNDLADITQTIESIFGTKLNWTPLTKNWEIPTEEIGYDHWITAWYNQEIKDFPYDKLWHYYYNNVYDYNLYQGVKLECGHIIPNGTFPLNRYNGCPFCGTPFTFDTLKLQNQGSKKRLLELWTEKNLVDYLESLLSSKLPLDASQTDSLKILLRNLDYDRNTDIVVKETLILVIDELIAQEKPLQAGAFFRSPTDILRYLWYKKTGFLQIIEPKTLIKNYTNNHKHINNLHDISAFAKTLSKEKLKLKYSRKEAKIVALWLNHLTLDIELIAEQMHPKRGMWVRFIRALRLTEYSKKTGFENLKKLLDVFYNQTYQVWQGRVNHFRLKSDAKQTFALLKSRPGLFTRSLFANMLWFGAETTLDEFKQIISQVPLKLIFTLDSYADIYFQKNTIRNVRTIMGLRKNITSNKYTTLYTGQELEQMQKQVRQLCLFALKERYSLQKTDYQQVYIDPILYNIPFPIGDRGQNIQDVEPTFMGERIPIEGNKIRLFMQWGEGLVAQHLDMDLSAYITYTNAKATVCNYLHLHHQGCKHSGDIRSIPDKIGTAEYIEIDINQLRKNDAKYVMFTCNAYSTGSISPNLVVGWMDSKHKMKISERSGVAYDPSCVIRQIRITQALVKGLVFGVLDIQNSEIIWLEMPFVGQTAYNLNIDTVNAFLEKIQSKISIGKILRIKADAQQQLMVENPNSADLVCDLKWAKKIENLSNLLT
ncbi:MAG: hypothetical protein Q4B43_06225 [Bacteroidota bacterium]|nr:hypothetical protein [Bacteroidota bacterium]